MSTVTEAVKTTRDGMFLWRFLHAKMVAYLWQLFRSRMLARPEAVVDEREARALTQYTTVYPVKYRDLLDRYCTSQEDAEEQVQLMQAVLRQHRCALSRIFQYYW